MKKLTLFFLTLLLGLLPALAQQTVTGTVVTAPDNEAAVGASVVVKEHSKVGITVGLDGSFKLTVPAGSKTLRISYIGYLTQEVAEVFNFKGEAQQGFALPEKYAGLDRFAV